MLSLTIKDIRKVLEETLSKFYDFVDYSIEATKVMDRSKEFRIEFRIYDSHFWIDIDPEIDSVYIASRSFSADHLDSIQMWLSKPFEYDKNKFEFGWRSDIERFFDAFHDYLNEKVKSNKLQITSESIIGKSTKDDAPVKIGPFNVDNLTNYLEEEEAASYEEYAANPPKTSVLTQILEKMYEEETPVAKVDESKVGECKIAGKPSIFNSIDTDENRDEYI